MTKKRLTKPLYKILNDLKGEFESKVIRSYQLAPGVGGFRLGALLDLLEDISITGEPSFYYLSSKHRWPKKKGESKKSIPPLFESLLSSGLFDLEFDVFHNFSFGIPDF
jgi:hypothetical protein